MRVVSPDGTVDVPATVVSPPPPASAWTTVVAPTTPVRPSPPPPPLPPRAGDGAPGAGAGPPVADAAAELGRFLAAVAAVPGRRPRAEDEVLAPVRALGSPTRPAYRDRAERLAARASLSRSGFAGHAALLAVGEVADHARASAGPAAPAGRNRDATRPVPDVDGVVDRVLGHPPLARLVGLCVDLTIPAPPGEGERTLDLRVVGADGRPLDGPVARPQPWSRVVCDAAAGRFVMARQPDAPTEVADGMLALGDPAVGAVATGIDVVAASVLLEAFARARLAPGRLRLGEACTLPDAPAAGITLAAPERGARLAAHARRRARELGLDRPADGAPGTGPVLFADDVTVGHRVDVAVDGGPFRPLMRRLATWTVGPTGRATTLGGEDEGWLPRPAALGPATDGPPAGEVIVAWDGGPLADPAATDEDRGDDGTGAEGGGTCVVPGVRHRAVPLGGGADLREGRRYEFRLRAVDLAGNSHPCDPGDRTHALDAGHHGSAAPAGPHTATGEAMQTAAAGVTAGPGPTARATATILG